MLKDFLKDNDLIFEYNFFKIKHITILENIADYFNTKILEQKMINGQRHRSILLGYGINYELNEKIIEDDIEDNICVVKKDIDKTSILAVSDNEEEDIEDEF